MRPKLLRVAAPILLSIYKASLYFLSFLGPVLVIERLRFLPLPALLAIAIVSYGASAVVFVALLVLTKRLVIGPIHHTGPVGIYTPEGKKWFASSVLTTLLSHSPFHPVTTGASALTVWYYRGMGARMPHSVLLGARSRLSDPWFLELGENVTIGADAVILGHLGHGPEVLLGRVIIRDNAVIGMRAVVFPDVHIGRSARVGAGALVVRGTVIEDGETWAGIPAKRVTASKEMAVAVGRRH